MSREIPERDWKELRRLKPILLNRFCQKVLDETGRIVTSTERTAHERYQKLYQFVQQEDRKIADAFNDHHRSTAYFKLMHLYSHGFLSAEEFMSFSEETIKFVQSVCGPQ